MRIVHQLNKNRPFLIIVKKELQEKRYTSADGIFKKQFLSSVTNEKEM